MPDFRGLTNWADVDPDLRDGDVDLLAELDEPTPEAERIAAVLGDLDQIPALHRRGVSHPDECGTCNEPYPCETVQAAVRIRRTLTGEDHHRD